MAIKKKTIERIMYVLLKQVVDHRLCPHCKKTFIPDDLTAEIARELLAELKAEEA